MKEQSYELRATDYELEDNLINLNKIKVQTSMVNGYFGTIPVREYRSVEKRSHTLHAFHRNASYLFLFAIVCNLKDYSIRNIKFNLGNLINLIKILVQTSKNKNTLFKQSQVKRIEKLDFYIDYCLTFF